MIVSLRAGLEIVHSNVTERLREFLMAFPFFLTKFFYIYRTGVIGNFRYPAETIAKESHLYFRDE